jgi:regulator of cell morphogenesis and NO signaling
LARQGKTDAPPEACNSWRVLYHTLAEFERDLHAHIHKENNILFPRALAMESALRSPASATRYTG